MVILFLSNYFPPYSRGGYEQWCAEVAIELQKRGHTVHVVTGCEPEPTAVYKGVPVHRILNLETGEGTWETAFRFLRRDKLEQESRTKIQLLIEQTRPDVAFIWGMWNVSRTVPALVELLMPGRVAYYFCDYWPTLPSAYKMYWSTESGRKATKVLKRLIASIALVWLDRAPLPRLSWESCFCISNHVCERLTQSGIVMKQVKVIHGGTQVEEFEDGDRRCVSRSRDDPLRLLYAGRLNQDKGVHTAVKAIGKLPRGSVILSVYGNRDSAFAQHLMRLVHEENLSSYIVFAGSVARSEMPTVMVQHDILLFPSVWEEPFSRVVIEGMAAGLAVIGTTTGGTGEILVEGETGLTFPAGDAETLAKRIDRLSRDHDLLTRLALSAQKVVNSRFQFEQMVDAIEVELGILHRGSAK